ncbi:MAG TPA: ribosomal L7Ae/L30e/S12e/Gadd45 family protein [Bacillota bacterium]|mgnify:CR=1 FL=1|jgi:large subunit ribosomal protein L7A|nr:50S ribosomal protein L7ae-like protein [Candidatus Fermentithermobacillaceae bacterium]HOB30443.1 ribosomal L7Ae/L30e/S12e/Gadd45 family protein [Bacillota bacterium]HOK64308.1 ribosomal L7Ae/L30e/S12e/Gadd45 family protein [Bacillota bacterium]HOL12679.1 ribosomal L7Ae/L30e/S12e/Gadd45 family protein [Bacillota bacterium]HOQ03052.1 ribosomal L7Ae/L30e/S12e/Gadd45 family protein [Bacillota bacterium]
MSPAYDKVPKRRKVIGAKSVERALSKSLLDKVLVAKDAEERVISDVLILAEQSGVEIVWVSNMMELGEYCGIGVGASCCGILKDDAVD